VRPEDEAEFAGLVERQWRFAFKVAWAVLRNGADAEDAAQEAFLKILRTAAWRGLRDERAFVARTVWRTAVDGLRSNAVQPIAGLAVQAYAPLAPTRADGDSGPDLEGLADPNLGPEDAVVAAHWEAAVHRLIDSLPEELRQPLALSAEMNSREIAAVMGIAEGTVRTRLMRARQMLREKMAALEERRYARE
jgi:RNA polymerase sigma-70 factor, ECF subfamily